jgi:CO/xanthine dehydrogenase FAD-binding subunit
VAIRNRASLVANSCNASPAADTAPPLLVLGARVTIASLDGDRTTSLDEFFLGPRRTLCGPGELVTRIDLPRPAPGSGSAFRRLTRRRGVDLATVSVAAGVGPEGGLVLGMGAVGPRPLRNESSEPVDVADAAALDAALDELLSVATPISDVRGSREYRLATLRVLTKRAVLTAADRRNPQELAS